MASGGIGLVRHSFARRHGRLLTTAANIGPATVVIGQIVATKRSFSLMLVSLCSLIQLPRHSMETRHCVSSTTCSHSPDDATCLDRRKLYFYARFRVQSFYFYPAIYEIRVSANHANETVTIQSPDPTAKSSPSL